MHPNGNCFARSSVRNKTTSFFQFRRSSTPFSVSIKLIPNDSFLVRRYLYKLLKQLMYRFMKKGIVNESTLVKLVEMDLTNPEIHKGVLHYPTCCQTNRMLYCSRGVVLCCVGCCVQLIGKLSSCR